MGCNDEDWAVFWCSLLSPVRLGEIPHRQRERYFQELSQEERLLPNGRRKRISVPTWVFPGWSDRPIPAGKPVEKLDSVRWSPDPAHSVITM